MGATQTRLCARELGADICPVGVGRTTGPAHSQEKAKMRVCVCVCGGVSMSG